MFKKILHCGGENNSIIQVCSKKSFIVMGKIAQGTALQEHVLKEKQVLNVKNQLK